MTTYVIGIDPGLTGALALITQERLVHLVDLPTMAEGKAGKTMLNAYHLGKMVNWAQQQAGVHTLVAAVERVNAMPSIPGKDGIRRTLGAASGFSLGRSLGIIEGVLGTCEVPCELVSPGVWKRHFNLGSDKEESRARAIRLYPTAELHLKKHHGRAEALLLARYIIDRAAGAA